MTRKQLETLSPPIMKQILPLVEQLPPLYMDLVKGREDFIPKPEETRRLVCDPYNVLVFMFHHGALSRLDNHISHYIITNWEILANLSSDKILLWNLKESVDKVRGWFNRWNTNPSPGSWRGIIHKLKARHVYPYTSRGSRSSSATGTEFGFSTVKILFKNTEQQKLFFITLNEVVTLKAIYIGIWSGPSRCPTSNGWRCEPRKWVLGEYGCWNTVGVCS